jgi:hypothetical protein
MGRPDAVGTGLDEVLSLDPTGWMGRPDVATGPGGLDGPDGARLA